MRQCIFIEAYRGQCPFEGFGTPPACVKHMDYKCWCGKQATGECAETMGLVCGQRHCEDHQCIQHGSLENKRAYHEHQFGPEAATQFDRDLKKAQSRYWQACSDIEDLEADLKAAIATKSALEREWGKVNL